MKQRLRALIILAILLFVPSALFANNFVWTGLGADNNWSNPANWDLGVSYPGEVGARSDTATINAGAPRSPTFDVALAAWLTLLTITGDTLTLTTNMGIDTLTMSGGAIAGPALTDITVRDDLSITAGVLDIDITFILTGAVGAPHAFNVTVAVENLTFNAPGQAFSGVASSVPGTLTITNSTGVQFTAAVSAGTITLTNTVGTIQFDGLLTATTLNTVANGYNVVLNGGGTITNAVSFLNTGSLTIDPSGFIFTGGASKITGAKSFDGTIGSTNAALNFGTAGAVTLTGSTTFSSGTGAITLFDVTAANFNLVLQGSGADVLGVVNLGTGTLNLTGKTGGSVTVNGALTAATLSTIGNAYSVALNAGGTVSGAVATTFSNTGTVTFGNDAADVLSFEAGLIATAPTTRSLAGTISTLDAAAVITFGGANAINVTANTTLGGAGTGLITLGAAVVLPDAVTLTLGAGAASAVSTQAISGTAAGVPSNLTINTTAAVTVAGAVGTDIGTVLITNSGGTTFNLGVTATTVTLTNTTGTITFTGVLTATTLNTAGIGYAVTLNGGGTVTNAVIFSNTGALTIGGVGFAFTGGAQKTVAGAKSFQGTISAAGAALNFGTAGAVTLTNNTTFSSGAGAITLFDLTAANFNLILQGSGADVLGVVNLGTGTLNLTGKTGGSVTVNGALTAATLSTIGNAYSVALNAGGTVSGAVVTTFSNTGTVTFGNDAADVLSFEAGLIATAPTTRSLAGTISALDAAAVITFGGANAINVTANTTLGGAGTGLITLGAAVVLPDAVTLTLGAGAASAVSTQAISGTAAGVPSNLTINTTAAVTVAGAVGTDIGTILITNSGGTTFSSTVDAATVTLTNTTGTITFTGALTATTLSTIGNAYSVALNAGGTVSGAVATTFSNTGTVTFGNDAADVLSFEAGLIATAPTTRSLAGTISALDAAAVITFGGANAINVTANTTLGGAGTGLITLGAAVVLPDAVTLTLGAGAASAVSTQAISGTAAGVPSNLTINTTAAVTVAGAVGTDIGTVLITNSGGTTFNLGVTATTVTLTNTTGTITFTGALTATTLNTAGIGYAVTLNGGGTVTNAVIFSNTGALTIGGVGFAFTGGAQKTVAGAKSFQGTISAAGAALNFGTAGAVTLTNNTTFSSGAGAITLFDLTAANFNLILQGSGADVLGVVNLGTGTLNLTGKTGGSVTVNGALTAATLSTIGNAYSVALNAGGTVSGAVVTTFSNTGTVTFGNDAADVLSFEAGLIATAPTTRSLAGTISALDAAAVITFGGANAINVTANTTLGGAGTGLITLGAAVVLPDAVTLTLGAGAASAVSTQAISGTAAGVPSNLTINTTAAVTVAGAVGTDIGTILITNSGGTTFNLAVTATTVTLTASTGTVTFTGALGATTLNVLGGVNNVALSAGGTISGAAVTTFSNTGTVSITGVMTTLSGGIDTTTGPTGTILNGWLVTDSGPIGIGALTLTGPSLVDSTNFSLPGNTITIASVSGAGFTLDLSSGDGATTINGALSVANLNLQALTFGGTGAMTFNGLVTVTGALTTSTDPFPISLNAGGTVSGAVVTTFSNTGTVTLGNDAADVLSFEAGLIATAPTTRSLAGTISALDAAAVITFGGANAINVTANTTLGGAGTGLITLGAAVVLPDAVTLTLGAGAASAVSTQAISGTAAGVPSNLTINTTAAVTVAGAVGTDIGTVLITNSGGTTFNLGVTATTVTLTNTTGTITFTGALTATTLNTAVAAYSVALNAGGTVSGAIATTFSNTGTVTFGNDAADVLSFEAGLIATAPTTRSLAGTISALDAAAVITFGGANAINVTANTTLGGAGTGLITLGAAVVLPDAVTLTLGAGAASAVSTQAISGTAAGVPSNLTINTTAAVTVAGAVGTDIGTVLITNSGGTTFNLGVTATTVTLTNTTGTITFTGALTATTLNTAGIGYAVTLNGGGTVTNAVIFSNTGALTIGGVGFAFTGGAQKTVAGAKSFQGTISAAGAALNFGTAGAVTLTNNTTFSSGAGAITLFDLTAANFNLILQGSGADVLGVVNLGTGTLNLTGKTGGSVTVNGALTAATLSTIGNAYSVALNAGGTVSGAVVTTFSNTGTVTFGNDAADVLSFEAGLIATAPTTRSLAGTISALDAAAVITFGGANAINVTANTTLGGAGTGLITLGAAVVLPDAVTLTLGAGAASAVSTQAISGTAAGVPSNLTINTTAAVTVAGAVGTDIGTVLITNSGGTTFNLAVTAATVTLTNTTGTITFTNNLTVAGNLSSGAFLFSINFNNAPLGQTTTIGGTATLLNTNTVSFGNNAADIFSAVGGLNHAAGASTVIGSVSTSNTLLTLGTVTITGACTLDSGTGNLTLGNITINDGITLVLGTGVATTISTGSISGVPLGLSSNVTFNTTAAVTVAGAVGTDIGTVLITNSGGTTFSLGVTATTVTLTASTGTVAFTGALTATTLSVAAGVNNVALNGGGTITAAVTFSNAGSVTLGNDAADVLAFTAGVVASAPATRNLAGTITAAGVADLNFSGANPINVTATTLLGGTTTGTIWLTVAVTLPDGVTLTLGSGGAATTIVTAAISGTAGGLVSDLDINTTAAANIGGAIGTDIGTVTVTSSSNTVFTGAVSATTVTLTASTGTITFSGALTAATLTVAGGVNNVALNAGGTISGPLVTTFGNSGTVTLGNDAGDVLAFNAGVTATVPATRSIVGTISAAGVGAINLGGVNAINVTANTALGGAGTGAITLGAAVVLPDGATLTLGAGAASAVSTQAISGTAGGAASDLTINTTAAATIGGAVGTDIGTITVTNSGGTTFNGNVTAAAVTLTNTTGSISFVQNLTATSLLTAGNAYNVILFGTNNSVSNDTAFLNTGTVTLGNGAGDTTQFTNGIRTTGSATNPSGTSIGGILETVNAHVDLGPVTLNSNATVDSTDGGAGAGAAINIASVTALGANLTLLSRSAATTVSGAIAGVNALTLQDLNAGSTGAMSFDGSVGAASIVTFAANYKVSLNAGGNITTAAATTFFNTGTLALGNDAFDVIAFAGSMVATNPNPRSLAGTISVANAGAAINMGGANAINVTANTTLGGTGTGAITLGAAVVLPDGVTLTLGAGAASAVSTQAISGIALGAASNLLINTAAAANINGAVGTDIGTITVTSSTNATFSAAVTATTVTLTAATGTALFTGALNATTFNVAAGVTNVTLNGGGTVTNPVNFLNPGALTIDPSGFTFTNGAQKLAGAKSFAGTITAINAALDFGTAGAVTLTNNTIFNSGTGAITLFDLTAANFNLTLQGSGADALGVVDLGTGTLNLTLKTGGAVTVGGLLTAGSLTTVGNAYAIALNGGATVTAAANFQNTGTLTLGNDLADVFAFGNAVTATAPLGKLIAGTFTSTNDDVDLGTTGTTVTANTTISTGTGSITLNGVSISAGATLTLGMGASTPITTGAVSGALGLANLTINTSDVVTVGGAVGPNIGGVTVTNSGGTTFTAGVTAVSVTLTATTGTVIFTGALTLTGNLSSGAGAFDIAFNAAGGGQASAVGGMATMLNTGTVSFGNNVADTFVATGSLSHTTGASTLVGALGTTGAALTLDTFDVIGDCSVGTGVGAITLGDAVIQDGSSLVLGTGAATTIGTGSISGVAGGAASNLTISTTGATTIGGTIGTDLGTLTISGTGIVDVGSNDFTVNTLVNNGTFQLTGTQAQSINNSDTDSGIIVYNGLAGGTIGITDFYTLQVNGAGTFALAGPISVGDPTGGGLLQISSGVLDVTGANHQITMYGDWNNVNVNAFVPRQGTVMFAKPSGIIRIFGNNRWFIFDCQVPGITIQFQQGMTQTMVNVSGAVFRVKGTNLQHITLNSEPAGGPLHWNFTLNVNAMLDMDWVDINWSQATIIIPVPLNVTIANCIDWVFTNFVLASQTEDLDQNGKIDRIRVTVTANINDNFSDFTASVPGYTLSPTGPGGLPYDGLDAALADDEFWILLIEHPDLDTGTTPAWQITGNSQLRDSATQTYLVLIQFPPFLCADAAPPIFGYTLAVADKNEIFIQFSEPVERPGGGVLLPGDFAYSGIGNITSLTRITFMGNGTSELLLTLDANVSALEAVTPEMLTAGALRDQAVVPNVILSGTHRVTDVGLGLAGDGVMEAVFANDGLFNINDFTGGRWLRDMDITVQGHIHNAIGLDPGTRLWFDVNVPVANRSASGFWLPPFDVTAYNGIVPWPVTSSPPRAVVGTPVTTQLRNFTIPSGDPEIVDGATVEFVFEILSGIGIADDLYCARVLNPAAVDWYRQVVPWSFDIHDEKTQKAGVTILHNVINPDLGEVTTLHYVLEKKGTVTISVYDLAGDLVRVLARTSGVAAGDYLQTWDGKNASGKVVARGVYFIRIVGPGIDEVRKVLVTR